MQSIIEIDLHGRNRYQAKVALDAALRRAPLGTMRIRAIHGFHCGTSLRDMIEEEYSRHPKVLRLDVRRDGGATDLVLREL